MTYGDVRVDIYRSKTIHLLSSAEFLPFKDETFDLVYSRCVFEHLPNALSSLLEQKRVCKINGQIEIITDNAGYWAYHMLGQHTKPMLKRKREKWIGQHYALYTKEHLQNLFSLAGIVPIKIEFRDFGTKADFLNKMVRALRVLENFSYPRIRAMGLRSKLEPKRSSRRQIVSDSEEKKL